MITIFNNFIKEQYDDIELIILDYINTVKNKDKEEYNFNTDNFDFSWIVDEILQFLSKSFNSYIYKKFHKKYDYYLIKSILEDHFPKEYKRAIQIKMDRITKY